MASLTRRSAPSLESQIYHQVYEFEFSQAIRILEGLDPECVPLGEGDDPSQEALHIKSRLTSSISSSDLYRLSPPIGDKKPVLVVNFLGIAGIQGPLPSSYSELIIDQVRHKDFAGQDFLDIFNHRLACFWHRVRKKVVLGMDQIPPEKTKTGQIFLDLLGIPPSLHNHLKLPDRSLFPFVPLFWQSYRSTAGLHQLLEGYFQVKINIKECQGKWRYPLAEDLTRIGQKKGQHHQLGKSTLIGIRSWDVSAGIQMTLQSLSWEKYLRYLPGAVDFLAIESLTRFYIGTQLTIRFCVTVSSSQIPPLLLKTGNARLGQTTWLTRGGGKGMRKDPFVFLTVF